MASYKVIFKPSVEKDLRPLPKPYLSNIFKKIQDLETTPLPYNATKLTGTENLYRIRVGDYRIVYSIDHNVKQIVVHYVRHRREVYRHL
ncbi:MAG: type II toxin-antitoxin system RelE/ParE family toxin [Elusimicrobia bacterium]|nr:type II toxin-antitoxin system RelE/ParE family toxin [Candidatus Obscuribacterium magneticum]